MRAALLLPVVAATLLLAGCAPTVSLTPAPFATSTRCAGVVVRLPDTIGSATRRSTDAQGTAAWGVPASVTLTCGVPAPGATTTSCTTIGGVDWLLEERTVGGAQRQVFTTFGREPTTIVVVDAAAVRTDDVLSALSDPIAAATRTTGQRCLSQSETAA